MKQSVLSSLLRIDRHYRRFLKCALSPCRYIGVMHLIALYAGRHPGACQEEIAAFFALDKASVARDARRLEELGHLERRTAPENRRQYQLFLTDAGQHMIGVIESVTEQYQQTLSANLSPEELQRLVELLARLEKNVCPAPRGAS